MGYAARVDARLAVLVVGAVGFAGCATPGVINPDGVEVVELRPDDRGFVAGTGIESQDLVAVSDKMARSILATPEIAALSHPPTVALDPVVNETRFPINKDLFLSRIRALLSSRAAGRVRFLARDRMATLEQEQRRKREGLVRSSSDPREVGFRGVDYFVTGRLQGLSTRTSRGTSDYLLYTFQLVDARTSEIVWEDMAEIKKQGQEDAAYR